MGKWIKMAKSEPYAHLWACTKLYITQSFSVQFFDFPTGGAFYPAIVSAAANQIVTLYVWDKTR